MVYIGGKGVLATPIAGFVTLN